MKCSVFGHRKIEEPIDQVLLENVFVDLIENKDIREFYFGGFGEFDELCYKIISKLKILYPYIRRIYCLTDEKHLSYAKLPNYLKENEYEEFMFLPLTFYGWYKRIYIRNCAMIDDSDYIVFYVNQTKNSGAHKALLYAKKNKKAFLNICEKPC